MLDILSEDDKYVVIIDGKKVYETTNYDDFINWLGRLYDDTVVVIKMIQLGGTLN